jgi:hydroxypyruvate reductase
MVGPERFHISSLESHLRGDAVKRVLASAFNSVEPGAAVGKYLSENPLPEAKRIFVLGLGKAACAMIPAFMEKTAPADSLVITKHASPSFAVPAAVILGNHPVPGSGSLEAGSAALKFASQLEVGDLLVCLISGGGSALMTAPRIPLEDLQSLTSALLACGARIDEINILRRHLDRLKGGGLANLAVSRGASVLSLILSDVVGDSLEAIASGPTAPDPTSCADALAVINKYGLKGRVPDSIIPALTETVKPEDPIFKKVKNVIVASNSIALQAVQEQAQVEGFRTKIIRTGMQGEARIVGGQIALQLKESLFSFQRPFCLLAGGETTVTLNGKGKGGRNQEVALSAVDALDDVENVMLVSLGTDGEDGPTDAAGAVVTGETAQRAESLGMNAASHLSRNDAYPYFDSLGDLVKTGPSGTNVNDLVICFAF